MLGITRWQKIGDIASISKANPAVITIAQSARPVDQRVQVGVYVHVYAPGWSMFDGSMDTRQVTALDAAAGLVTIAADTTAQVDTTIRPNTHLNMMN